MTFEIDYTKATDPATYKQLEYLRSLGVTLTKLRSSTQFMKRVNKWQVSEAIVPT